MCSLCGSLLSIGVCLAVALGELTRDAWFIDALVALLVSVGLFAYSCHTLVKNARQRNTWWGRAFWLGKGAVNFSNNTVSRLLASPHTRVTDTRVISPGPAALNGAEPGGAAPSPQPQPLEIDFEIKIDGAATRDS